MDSAPPANSTGDHTNRRCVQPRVLITAGPTHEPIDRVRYIGNRSSGRMGIALAEACLARAWPVTLLLGPVSAGGISPLSHPHLTLNRFQTAAELQDLLQRHWPSHDLLLMAAAVADFRVKQSSDEKLKRGSGDLTLVLEPTPDLLAGLANSTQPQQIVVGFALEPAATLASEASRKLRLKSLDAIVANPLETMDAADVTATILLRNGQMLAPPPNLPKLQFATWLVEHVLLSLLTHGKGTINADS